MGRLPTSEPAKRIATLFRRRLTTSWCQKEVARFRQLKKDGCFDDKLKDDLALIERYYASERKKPDGKGVHRRDLITFLNNYRGELDRANEWAETHPLPKSRKIIPMPPVKSDEPAIPVEPELREKFLADFKAKRGRNLWQPNA